MWTRRELMKAGLGTVAAQAMMLQEGHAGVPLGAAATSPDVPASLVHRSAPPAKHMTVISVNRLPPEEATAFAILQGLVNRRQPRLFLVYDSEDAFWLDWLRQRGDVGEVEWIGRYDAFRRYRDEIKGCIVADPELPATVNVATFLSGLLDSIVVSPELVDVFGLPIKMDLRGRWRRSIDACRWARDEYFPKASRRVLAHLNPHASRLRDYMAAFNVFTFFLTGTDDEEGRQELEFAGELFTQMGPNKPVLGWWGAYGRGKPEGIREQRGVDLASEYGLVTVCMDWDGYCEGTSNLTVHSGTRATLRQNPAPPPPKLEAKKVYYALVRTDGDGTNFWRQEFLHRWDDAQHGQIPVSWPIGPLGSEFIPDILDYFYTHATPKDLFMAAVSGLGYIHEEVYGQRLPVELRERSFAELCRLTGEYMQRMDLHHLHTYKTSSPTQVAQFAGIAGLRGLFLNYKLQPGTTAANAAELVNGVPVFHSVTGSVQAGSWQEKIQQVRAQILELTPAARPAFLSCSLTNWAQDGGAGPAEMETLGVIRELQRTLGPEYVPVRADHLAQLFIQHAQTH